MIVPLVLALAVLTAAAGDRAPKRKRRAPPVKVPAGPVVVPIDIGVGPVLLLPNPGPIFDDQPVHFGLALSIAAVIDQQLIRKHANRIPKQWRGAARGLGEVRYRPWFLALVPELLVISPQLKDTGIYGAVWRPLAIGVSLFDEPVRVSVGAGIDVAALVVHSTDLGGGTTAAQSFTLVLRPGVNLEAVVELPLGDSVSLSTGWSSDVLLPQPLGRPPWEVLPLNEALWHLGGPFLKLHVRIPYEVNL